LSGRETFYFEGVKENLTPRATYSVRAVREDGTETHFEVLSRIDSKIEVEYYKHGGILQYVLRSFLQKV
jgi:aconitate hydratase